MLVITIDDLAENLDKYIELAASGEEVVLLVSDKEVFAETTTPDIARASNLLGMELSQ